MPPPTSCFTQARHPEAILLTHGHLDHLGSAKELADHWNVPVIAHPLEMPYLTGQALYPPRDPTVGGSLAFMSRFFPTQLPNLGERVQALDADDPSTPHLMAWRWLHVPGHAPGQLAFFREADRALIGADAFATCHHDSIPAVLLGIPKISRAGTPFNYDWEASRHSVQTAGRTGAQSHWLRPRPGHHRPGSRCRPARSWPTNYPVPAHGRYVHEPARTDASGVEHLPPPPKTSCPCRRPSSAAACWLPARRGCSPAAGAEARSQKA